MAIMDISVVPVGTSSTSISQFVADAVRAARQTGLEVNINAMGTVLSGPVDELLAAARAMHTAVLAGGAKRVLTTIKIDDRTDRELTPEGKVAAVKSKLPSY
jgi:uncharacterized protein (TIGR00106 family)